MNAMKHGLRARVLLPDDLAEHVDVHAAAFRADLKPETPYQEWLVGEAARAAAKLDRCAELSTADLLRVVEQADVDWDQDRRRAVEDLGARLSADPSRIAHALRGTKHGADWLIGRWDGLAHLARTLGTWDAAQRSLALDLLGTPPQLRAACAKLPADADAATLAALADREAAALRTARAAYLDHLDERARELTAAGAPPQEDATSACLRRYEAECRRALRWALAEFRRVRTGSPRPVAATPTAPPPPAAPEPFHYDSRQAARDAIRDAAADFAAARAASAPAPAPSRKARRAQERLARQAAARARSGR